MIVFNRFAFATPPRTASAWFMNAALLAGLSVQDAGVITIHSHSRHQPPPAGYGGFVVSMVRHPVDWLLSVYTALRGGAIGLPAADAIAALARATETPEHFLRACVTRPGIVSQVFAGYQACSTMRVEDLPWCAVEFFESVGVHKDIAAGVAKLTPLNCYRGMPPRVDPELRQAVVESERSFCEAFEYF